MTAPPPPRPAARLKYPTSIESHGAPPGAVLRHRLWDVVSVDINPKAHPAICCDLLELTVQQCTERGPIDFAFCSPPCTQYSRARTVGPPRDLEGSDRLVQKCLDLCGELGAPFVMENPFTGLLKSRDVVAGIPMRVVDYCKYGAPYRKRTALWTNTEFTVRTYPCPP